MNKYTKQNVDEMQKRSQHLADIFNAIPDEHNKDSYLNKVKADASFRFEFNKKKREIFEWFYELPEVEKNDDTLRIGKYVHMAMLEGEDDLCISFYINNKELNWAYDNYVSSYSDINEKVDCVMKTLLLPLLGNYAESAFKFSVEDIYNTEDTWYKVKDTIKEIDSRINGYGSIFKQVVAECESEDFQELVDTVFEKYAWLIKKRAAE